MADNKSKVLNPTKTKVSQTAINHLVEDALAIEAMDAKRAGAVAYMARVLVQATLPHREVKGNEYVRTNGNLTVSMVAPSEIGLPYGSYPRLLLMWLSTEAVKTGQREIVLGRSLADFMQTLGLTSSGGERGAITLLKDQTRRLFHSTIHISMQKEEAGIITRSTRHMGVAAGETEIETVVGHLWREPKNPSQSVLWPSTVELTQEFFKEVIERPVPLDMRALLALKQSPMALDVYQLLTYRMSYLERPITIPWDLLQLQFGAGYADTPQGRQGFKRGMIEAIQKIQVIYQELKVESVDRGLKLRPSPTHVLKTPAVASRKLVDNQSYPR